MYDLVKNAPYPRGWVLSYTHKYNPELNDAVVSLGFNRFVKEDASGSIRIFESYDEWLCTLPPDAQSDIGIKEHSMQIHNLKDYIRAVLSVGSGSH